MNIQELTETREDSKVRVQEAEPKIKEPSLYRVLMHNDDYTPMEFVVTVLELFFHMERAKAITVMFEVHTIGRAICGVYSKDIAETKVDHVVEYAKRHEFPLLCSIEVV